MIKNEKRTVRSTESYCNFFLVFHYWKRSNFLRCAMVLTVSIKAFRGLNYWLNKAKRPESGAKSKAYFA